MAKSASNKVIIRGQVMANEWDAEDNPASLMITDDEEREFYIEMNSRGEELLDFLDEYVEVVGVVKKWEGDYYLNVRSFDVIEDYDDDDDDDWVGDEDDGDWGDDNDYDDDYDNEDEWDNDEETYSEWDEDDDR